MTKFKAGDVFYIKELGQYRLFKLLKPESDFDIFHLLLYAPISQLPLPDTLGELEILAYHAPISASSFAQAEFLTSTPLQAADLMGYHEYLRQTTNPDYWVALANEYYREGYALTDAKKYEAAIDAYSKAIDLFPRFFEAIDNRAFCKMDMGLWSEAIEDFELSLQVQPGSLLAVFSIGESYFKMGEYSKAKPYFEEAQRIDPTHPVVARFLNSVNEKLS